MRRCGKRRRIAARILGLLVIAIAPSVRADEFKLNGIAVDVPANFDGPVSAQPDVSAQTHAFSVRSTSSLTPSSVLQVTVLLYGSITVAEAERPAAVSQRYLSQMLEGIERRRTEYHASAPQEIRVAGLPGSVVSWRGRTNRIGTNGKMYCIVTESGLMFFHVMGGGNAPNADMAAAIEAVESARNY